VNTDLRNDLRSQRPSLPPGGGRDQIGRVAAIRSVGWPPSGWNTWPPWIGIHTEQSASTCSARKTRLTMRTCRSTASCRSFQTGLALALLGRADAVIGDEPWHAAEAGSALLGGFLAMLVLGAAQAGPTNPNHPTLLAKSGIKRQERRTARYAWARVGGQRTKQPCDRG
jgi:hypothetical protein